MASTRAFNLRIRAFSHLVRGFELVTRRFELVTREFELVTSGFELVTHVLLFHYINEWFELICKCNLCVYINK